MAYAIFLFLLYNNYKKYIFLDDIVIECLVSFHL